MITLIGVGFLRGFFQSVVFFFLLFYYENFLTCDWLEKSLDRKPSPGALRRGPGVTLGTGPRFFRGFVILGIPYARIFIQR